MKNKICKFYGFPYYRSIICTAFKLILNFVEMARWWSFGRNILSQQIKVYIEYYVLLTVHPGTTPAKWPTWCTITLYNLDKTRKDMVLQYHILTSFIQILLLMFYKHVVNMF